MWDILIPPLRNVHVALCHEDKDEMILRMNIITYICIIACASWIYCLIKSGSELVRDMGFELGFLVDMVLWALVGCPLVYFINMLPGLTLFNSFVQLKNLWMEFHLDHWLAWWLAMEKDLWLDYHWELYLDHHLTLQILDWLALYLSYLLEILLYLFLTLFGISIGVVLGLTLVNYFDTPIGSLLWYSVDLELGTLIVTLMRPLLENKMGRSI